MGLRSVSGNGTESPLNMKLEFGNSHLVRSECVSTEVGLRWVPNSHLPHILLVLMSELYSIS